MPDQSLLDYINTLEWPVVVSAALFYWRQPISGILKRVSESKRGSAKVGPAALEWDDTLQEVNAVLAEAETKPASPVFEPEPKPDEATEPIPADAVSDPNLPDAPVADDEKETLTPNEALNRRRQIFRERDAATAWGHTFELTRAVFPDMAWARVLSLVDISPSAAVVMAFTELEGEVRRNAAMRGIETPRPASVRTLMRLIELPTEIVEAVEGLSRLRNAVTHEGAQPTAVEALEYIGSTRRVYDLIYRDTYFLDKGGQHNYQTPSPPRHE